MKKTLYVLFVFLLMFLGNIEVLANTTHNTQESDGGGETIYNPNEEGKVCKYRYTGDIEVHVWYSDADVRTSMVFTKTGNPLTSVISRDFNYGEWISYVGDSKTGCPYVIFVNSKLTPLTGPSDCDTDEECTSSAFEYRIQLEKTNFFVGLFDKYVESTAYCTNCSDVNFEFTYNSSEFDCKSLIGEGMISLINQGLSIIKIIVPILVIGLGIFDFVRAIFASSEDDMKKAQKTFVRRLIIAVIIFFSPILINLVINITNEAAGFVNSGTCGIG